MYVAAKHFKSAFRDRERTLPHQAKHRLMFLVALPTITWLCSIPPKQIELWIVGQAYVLYATKVSYLTHCRFENSGGALSNTLTHLHMPRDAWLMIVVTPEKRTANTQIFLL